MVDQQTKKLHNTFLYLIVPVPISPVPISPVELFDRSKLRTEWDMVRHNSVIGGITLPETIHQGIVRDHLKPLELTHPPKKES